MIPDEQLAAVWADYAESGSTESLEILLAQYAGLAGYLARKALAKAPAHQDREDMLSYAHHGLLDAIQRFDPGQGVKFETYATRRITGAIIDAQRRDDPLSRQTRRRVKIVAAAVEELWEERQIEPTVEQIADRANLTVEDVKATFLARQSLSASLDADGTDMRGMTSEAEVATMLAEVRARLAHRLAGLSPRARMFILKLYVDDLSMRDLQQFLSISPAWCRSMRASTMQELRRST